jgi:hypothetical protein
MHREFADKSNAWRGTPIIDEPVSVDEFRKAALQFQNYEEISNPKIKAHTTVPQQIFTICFLTKMISHFLLKIGDILWTADHDLKSVASSFQSYSKSFIEKIISQHDGQM